MNFTNLIDGPSAVIVVGGTLLATVLRSGFRDCGQTIVTLFHLFRPGFDPDGTRAQLAVQIQNIRKDGLLRAEPHHFADSEFEDVSEALIGKRSLSALRDAHERHRAKRLEGYNRAVRTLSQGAELAPVFGLAGTLVSLSQMPPDGLAAGEFTGAISMAVLTTLYGLLLANILLGPLARVVERAAFAEERQRQCIVDWLAAQVAPSITPAEIGQRGPTGIVPGTVEAA